MPLSVMRIMPIGKSGTLAETLGTVQPFRYRGYVFDEETGLYYLRSRYYNAERCRFVNADSVVSGNLFCYCYNSPIDLLDLSGKSPFLDWLKKLRDIYTDTLIENARINYKMNISLYSNVGLSVKEYPLANELFHHFLWEEGKPLSDDVIQQLSEQISASKAFQEKIIADYKTYGNSFASSFEFMEGDLHYAIGHADYSANVHEQNGTLIVSGALSDTYDFTELRKHDGTHTWLSVEANNLGYRLQKEGYGTEYAYAVPFEFEVP